MICTLWSRLFRCSPWTWTSIYTDVIHFAHINLSVAAAWRTLANFPCIFLHYFIFNIYVIYLVKYFWITDFNRGLVDTKVICIACNTFSFGYVVKKYIYVRPLAILRPGYERDLWDLSVEKHRQIPTKNISHSQFPYCQRPGTAFMLLIALTRIAFHDRLVYIQQWNEEDKPIIVTIYWIIGFWDKLVYVNLPRDVRILGRYDNFDLRWIVQVLVVDVPRCFIIILCLTSGTLPSIWRGSI